MRVSCIFGDNIERDAVCVQISTKIPNIKIGVGRAASPAPFFFLPPRKISGKRKSTSIPIAIPLQSAKDTFGLQWERCVQLYRWIPISRGTAIRALSGPSDEITSEIFIHFLPVYLISPPVRGLFSPIILTHICHQWREIALTTPALWRAINLNSGLESAAESKELLQAWITRSRTLPLSMDVRVYEDMPLETAETLGSHRLRWEFVKLWWLKADALSTFFGGSMPVLRHLDLALRHIPTPPFRFGDLPLLRSVTLYSVLEGIWLPWTQLTTLKLLDVYPFECTPILQQSVSLIHCELALYSADEDDSRQPDITLPQLQTLVLLFGFLFAAFGSLSGFTAFAPKVPVNLGQSSGKRYVSTVTAIRNHGRRN
ncbi:hypothetical protein C8R43DRAFT_1193044 [Mycena crocata]|nr:hypothetical protein C8R43DRAFT_1193044 [Mycena crocata]